MQCLDEKKLKDYLMGALPAELILPASEHVRSCDKCRSRLAELAEYARAATGVVAISTDSQDCPEYETLSAFVAEQLAGPDFTAVEHHILHCELCWQDVETLQAARSKASLAPEINVAPGRFARRSTWTVFGWRSAAATALGAAAVAVVLMLANPGVVKNPNGHQTTVAQAPKPAIGIVAPVMSPKNPVSEHKQPATTTIATNNASKTGTPTEHVAPPPTPAAERIAMNSGSVRVYSRDGKLEARTGSGDLESTVAAAVSEALKTGKVKPSFQLAKAGSGVLRGTTDTVEIAKVVPEPGGMTASARPTFKWAEVSGAQSYRIDVRTDDGRTVVSQETASTEFQPSEKLQPGFYRWSVSVRKAETGDWMTSKSEVFRLLSKSENEMFTAAKRDYADSHLVMGTVYQKLGLTKEAAWEFRALVRENPNSKLAQRLLQGAE